MIKTLIRFVYELEIVHWHPCCSGIRQLNGILLCMVFHVSNHLFKCLVMKLEGGSYLQVTFKNPSIIRWVKAQIMQLMKQMLNKGSHVICVRVQESNCEDREKDSRLHARE